MPRRSLQRPPAQPLPILVAGAAGLALGYLLATRGDALRHRLRTLFGEGARREPDDPNFPAAAAGDEAGTAEALEARVLEAFRHDPVLSRRAVDISATADDAIALGGWVRREPEIAHALTIARGTPGVRHVSSAVRVRTPAAKR